MKKITLNDKGVKWKCSEQSKHTLPAEHISVIPAGLWSAPTLLAQNTMWAKNDSLVEKVIWKTEKPSSESIHYVSLSNTTVGVALRKGVGGRGGTRRDGRPQWLVVLNDATAQEPGSARFRHRRELSKRMKWLLRERNGREPVEVQTKKEKIVCRREAAENIIERNSEPKSQRVVLLQGVSAAQEVRLFAVWMNSKGFRTSQKTAKTNLV